jgi:spore coat protein U-like protein
VWGDGTRGSQRYTVNSPPSGVDQSVPVYGKIFRHQKVAAGGYEDDVSVIVSY